MFSQTTLIILGGCMLGAIQLTVGIAIGMWFRRSDTADANRSRQDMIQANLIAKRLQALADEMSSSVGEHRSQLDQASQLLTSEGAQDEDLAELVVDVIGDIVRANQNLQSKLETAETRLQEQASQIETHISRSLTDPLTGLPNRREFNDRLEERMAAWNRRVEPFSLVILDVDHFKKLNDQHGHLAGDQVLATIGRALRGAIRRDDSVARYGGEEFAILLPNTTLDQSMHVAEKVREAVGRISVNHNGQRLTVTASGGFAAIRSQEPAESLIQRADSALYAAKAAGRNCAYLHDGRECRSIAQSALTKAAGAAAELIKEINSSNGAEPPSANVNGKESNGTGSYLPREEISQELAQTCEELRRFVEERSQHERAASSS
jgi:diguanylate cyclase